MSLKLNQLVALDKGTKTRYCAESSELYKIIQKPALFSGLTKSYSKKDDDDADLPGEKQKVQYEVPSVLKKLAKITSNYFDLTARKDITNTIAKADVVVNGVVVAKDVPATYLLFLEKQLVDIRTMLEKLPILDESEDWAKDSSGTYKTPAVQTHRTKKVQKALVLYPATEQHPAQTQLVAEDIIAGYWSTVKQSGAIPKTEREEKVERVDALLQAVKIAREQANSQEEAPIGASIGNAIFAYLNW